VHGLGGRGFDVPLARAPRARVRRRRRARPPRAARCRGRRGRTPLRGPDGRRGDRGRARRGGGRPPGAPLRRDCGPGAAGDGAHRVRPGGDRAVPAAPRGRGGAAAARGLAGGDGRVLPRARPAGAGRHLEPGYRARADPSRDHASAAAPPPRRRREPACPGERAPSSAAGARGVARGAARLAQRLAGGGSGRRRAGRARVRRAPARGDTAVGPLDARERARRPRGAVEEAG
jgi:hypothetical protein